MPLHKGLLKGGFKLPQCEKHFHEHDESWLVVAGRIKIGPIIQDVVHYTQAPSVYDRLRDDPGSLMGTVFSWE
jgi:threonine dehydrogenase-like Zn-dependent dehydrogenase